MTEKFDTLSYVTQKGAVAMDGILTKLITISKKGQGDGVDRWSLPQTNAYLNDLYQKGYRVVTAQAFDSPDALSVFYILQLEK